MERLKGAKIFSTKYNIPFIGIPGTIDNDLFGMDYTMSFDSAITTAVDLIDKVRDSKRIMGCLGL